MQKIKIGLVGIGGYAAVHRRVLDPFIREGRAELSALAEWNLDRFPDEAADLRASGTELFRDYNDMLAKRGSDLDLIVLPVGIHLHAPMTIRALEAGINVICEKPAAARVQDVDAMIAARERSGKFVLVGYQEIYSESIQRIKRILVSGRLGAVRSVKVRAGWPRSDAYYTRNAWAGKLKVGRDWILDSPPNNAMAHYLNNMLYLASGEQNRAAVPVAVRAELYRANPIETCDTAALEARLDSCAALFFF